MPITQRPHQKNTFGTFCLLLVLSFFLTQCGKNSEQNNNATHTSDGDFALSLPSALKKHQSGKNITAQLIIDGGTPINMNVDLDNDQVTASTGPLSPGIHSFVIQYFLDGALITTATSQATIIAGQNTNIVFTPDLNVNVAPTILATQPTESATDIAINSTVSATFSQPMDATAIIPINFTLNGLTSSIPGSVSYTETPPSFEARFTPTASLALAATYTANLNTNITGILGEPLTTAHTWSFTTADGTWNSVEGVDNNSVVDPLNNAASPQIALDANGNAIAVWSQTNLGTPGPDNIWANRYVKEIGWGTPQLIETDNAGPAGFPQVAVDASGNAIVVWQQSDGTRNNIWANRFNASTSAWGTANVIEAGNAGAADSPQIAIDATGNAMAVWRQNDGTINNIIANRFDAELGIWGNPEAIETGTNNAQTPQIAATTSGDAIAVWSQQDGTAFKIFANHFNNGTGSWGTAEIIGFNNAGDASLPKIAINNGGRAIAVWLQNDGSATNVVSKHFVPVSGWAPLSTTIDTETTQAFTPVIALDAQGNAFALWRQANASSLHIFSNRFESGTQLWSTPTALETESVLNIGFPQITFDPNGNAIAVWAQLSNGDSFDNVWSKRYTQNAGWQNASKLETEDLGSAGFPQIVLDASGNAIAVWTQDEDDGSSTITNVQSNRFQ